MATRGRLEGRIKVPTGGWTLSINDSGGGGAATATLAAGTYYWTSVDENGGGTLSFVDAVAAALNTAASTDTITVAISASENGTGRVSISSTGATTIAWASTGWRDVMGFTADLPSATSWVAPNHARSLWLPNCAYNAPNNVDAIWRGWREADYRSVENAAGHAWAHMGQQKVVNALRWASIKRSKVWESNESLTWESWERFCQDAIWGVASWGTPGGPLRFYPDADDSSLFATYMAMDVTNIKPEPYFEGWAGGPWRIELHRLVAVPDAVAEGLGGGIEPDGDGELEGPPPTIILPVAGFSYAEAGGGDTTQRQFPESASAWAAAFSGITTPSHLWTFQETASPILNKIGSGNMVQNVTLAYQQSGETQPTLNPRKSVAIIDTDVSARVDCSVTTVGDAGTGSMTLALRFKMPNNASTDRSIFGKGTGNGSIRGYIEQDTGKICFLLRTAEGDVTVKTANPYDDGAFHDMWFVIDGTGNLAHIITATEDVDEDISALTSGFTHASALRLLCSSGTTALAGTAISWAAIWNSTALTAANLATFATVASGGGAGDGFDQLIADPSYIYATNSQWTTLKAEAPLFKIAVINPASGPGSSSNSDYVTLVGELQALDVYVLGYSTTNYRDRHGIQGDGVRRDYANIDNVKDEIDRWYSFYGVDGMFFDEMDPSNVSHAGATGLTYYTELYNYVKTKGGVELVIQNPGLTGFNEIFINVADTFMSAETYWDSGSLGSYRNATIPSWQRNYPASKFWHCIHTCPANKMAECLALSRTKNAGYIYITDDVMPNPYNVIPTYWASFVAAVEAANGEGGYTVQFDSSASTPGSTALTIASYFWTLGDGTTSTLANPLHTYASPGNKTVTLTITDSAGKADSFTSTVVVG